MPGNETTYKSPRSYLPVAWNDANLPPNATREMAVGGAPVGLDDIPVPRKCSVVSISALLSQALTSGSLTLTLRKNGSASSIQATVGTGATTNVVDLAPGAAVYEAGDTIGIELTTSAGLAPAGTIDVLAFVEVQNV